MEGKLSLPYVSVNKKLPILMGIMFLCGMGYEYVLCKTGFYNVYTVNEGQKAAERDIRQREFWREIREKQDEKLAEYEKRLKRDVSIKEPTVPFPKDFGEREKLIQENKL
ncbi:unnamed protein product [Vitrella brassicaformis CCMP3155]|uniref:Uncharacterized protein n=2 Tax=Vitrella brassicaformis TaxID=1169539 RepID=A0A0G4EF33_VITBC|nr:unnamed protein product [Vitrella brassicaformis CCMP3155]|mmetsp:Transcript_36836/g.92363  ORF Transcript_36836/g.92363 Transcript_36836/m.92363 type:complete len:110 (+) Transcript_36836:275-604(+)|eukprot:CEL94329.1 unnamed protein product [Vitrella brassicaformis CCMP3155]